MGGCGGGGGGGGVVVFFFFFKQKTAYEIKECDWSSDVCSSDLSGGFLKPDAIQDTIFQVGLDLIPNPNHKVLGGRSFIREPVDVLIDPGMIKFIKNMRLEDRKSVV